MSIFLESLLELAKFVNNQSTLTCEFDFYEQGIRYEFDFKKSNDTHYILDFVDKDDPAKAIQVKGETLNLNFMLYTFYSRVIFLTQKLCPLISNNEIFVEWKGLVNEQFGINY